MRLREGVYPHDERVGTLRDRGIEGAPKILGRSHANTRRAYQQDIKDFMTYAGAHRPEQFREIIRAHVIAWRQQLVNQ